eukprot:CCRYP_012561-RA/>CCRYP_012561-RA protein AED:0.25 eAED:0.27 QI:0/0/0/1/1/1/3/0/611
MRARHTLAQDSKTRVHPPSNSVYHTTTLAERIQYIHQCLFSPTVHTLCKAIDNDQLIGFPPITSAQVRKYLPESTATAKGHLRRVKKHTRSTTHTLQTDIQAIDHDFRPNINTDVEFELFVGATIAEQTDGTIYTDQTGAFPVTSYHSNKYHFVAYKYRSNAILVRALKDQTDKSLTAAFRDFYEYLTERGFQPKLNVMDNQCSKAVEKYIRSTKAETRMTTGSTRPNAQYKHGKNTGWPAWAPSTQTVQSNSGANLSNKKDDPNRVRITVGGNLINYPGELTTRTADLTTAKILWNSTISTPEARFACADIENMYLQTPMDRYEYMGIKADLIPTAFMDAYKLWDKIYNGHIYMEIRRGCYGLPQAGILANKLLKQRLATDGYFELPHTPGLFKHISRPVQFTLVVNDFGIKYIGEEHLDHLLHTIKKHYDIKMDLTGSLYCGISLHWDYNNNFLDISMPGYVNKQLTKYNHPRPKKPVHTPWEPYPIKYGSTIQATLPPDDSPPLNSKQIKHIQQIAGSFLYYSRATDPTIAHALSELATQQAHATENTLQRCKHFLDYMTTHPDARICYHASDMILNVHSDASYLSVKAAKSRPVFSSSAQYPKTIHP